METSSAVRYAMAVDGVECCVANVTTLSFVVPQGHEKAPAAPYVSTSVLMGSWLPARFSAVASRVAVASSLRARHT